MRAGEDEQEKQEQRMKSKAEQSIRRIAGIKYGLILQGSAIGILAGLLISMFRLILAKAESFRMAVVNGLSSAASTETVAAVAAGFLLCFFCAWLCLRMEPMCAGSGIPQVAGELKGKIFQNWPRVIITKFVGASATIFAGLSLGREGPSIQLGAMVGKGFSSAADKLATEEKLLMTCGAVAGLSSAFSAPLAGVIFALEGLHKNFSTDILLGSMASSIAADFVAYYIFGLNPVFDLKLGEALPLKFYWTILLLGIFLGVFGTLYGRVVELFQAGYGKIGSTAARLCVPFAAAVPLALFYPHVLGGGYDLVTKVAEGKFLLGAAALLLAVKFGFSVLSFASGAPGGIFMPLLVIGGIAGGFFFMLFDGIMGMDEVFIANFVVYGMVGYFAAIVRSPVTGVILITEMVGDFRNFLSLCIVAFVAYIVADLMGSRPIYDRLLERLLAKSEDLGMDDSLKSNKVLLYSDVYIFGYMDGKKIEKMKLPAGSLVVAVNRGNEEIVPRGNTVLRGGDKLTVLCNQGDMAEVDEMLKLLCRTEGEDRHENR